MKSFKSGSIQSQNYYKSFQPNFINRKWLLDDMEIQHLLSQADRLIGKLDMYSEHIPNIDLFISMHVHREATQSTKIEGTQTNIEDSLLDKEDISPEKRDDWDEVQNYIYAMNNAMNKLETLPFSNRLIKESHRILLKGVRGKHKLPGEFRNSQNWIGGATINDAVFIPPVHTSIGELMSDLELFAHNQDFFFPELLKIAIIHYQFETIHPFLDGNGKVGRLLITLYLMEKGILKKPVLYLSDFFEKNKQLYYDNMMNVRTKNDLKQWLKFFLVGLIETAKNGIETFSEILKMKKEIEEKIQNLGKRKNHLLKIMDYLYNRPIINASNVVRLTKISQPTAYKLIEDLVKINVLKEMTESKRDKLYAFKDYLNLFR